MFTRERDVDVRRHALLDAKLVALRDSNVEVGTHRFGACRLHTMLLTNLAIASAEA